MVTPSYGPSYRETVKKGTAVWTRISDFVDAAVTEPDHPPVAENQPVITDIRRPFESMLGCLITFPIMVLVGVFVTVASGAKQPPPLLIPVLTVISFFMIPAINRAYRHAPKTPPKSAAAIPDSKEAPLVSLSHTADSIPDSPPPSAITVSVNDTELQNIRRTPGAFANVLPLAAPIRMGETTSEAWLLIIGRDDATLTNIAGTETWNVQKTGIVVHYNAFSGIEQGICVTSADGRKETLVAPAQNCAAALAWACSSYSAFDNRRSGFNRGWWLIAYELITGRSPQPLLAWQLPYDEIAKGIDMLSANSIKELAAGIRHIGPQILARLQTLRIGTEHPLFRAVLTSIQGDRIKQIVACMFVAVVFGVPSYGAAILICYLSATRQGT